MSRDMIMQGAIDGQTKILTESNWDGLFRTAGEVLNHLHLAVQDPKKLNMVKETFREQNGSVFYQSMTEQELKGFLKGLFWIKNEVDWVDLPVD